MTWFIGGLILTYLAIERIRAQIEAVQTARMLAEYGQALEEKEEALRAKDAALVEKDEENHVNADRLEKAFAAIEAHRQRTLDKDATIRALQQENAELRGGRE